MMHSDDNFSTLFSEKNESGNSLIEKRIFWQSRQKIFFPLREMLSPHHKIEHTRTIFFSYIQTGRKVYSHKRSPAFSKIHYYLTCLV
jgi:hypothetical protein